MNNIIKYSGLKDLNSEEQSILKSIVEKEFPKVQRLLKNPADLMVHIKTLKKETRKRFLISMRLEMPGKILSTKNLETEKGGDWDLTKALHKEMKSLESEVKHHLRTDNETWKKGTGIKALLDKFKS